MDNYMVGKFKRKELNVNYFRLTYLWAGEAYSSKKSLQNFRVMSNSPAVNERNAPATMADIRILLT